MKPVLKNTWKVDHGVIIKELDQNLFSFQFFSKPDRDHVLNDGPWSFDGKVLMLKEMTGWEQPSEFSFDCVRFWVKVYDVPGLRQTPEFAEYLGNLLGIFVDCEGDVYSAVDKSINFRLDLKIDKPLRRKWRLKVDGELIVIWFKYVKLSDFCFACGKLDHVYKGCVLYDDGIPEVALPYGAGLRASPLKPRRRSEAEILEEKRLLLEYQKIGRAHV